MKQIYSLVGAVVFLILMLPLSGCVYEYSRSESSRRGGAELELTLDSGGAGGSWESKNLEAALRNRWFPVILTDPDSNWTHGLSLDSSKFSVIGGGDFPTSGPLQFSLHTEAGTVLFEGTALKNAGAGTFQFEPDRDFKAEFEPAFLSEPSEREWLLLALRDVSGAFLRGLIRLGEEFSPAEITALRQSNVSLDYITALREGGIAFAFPEIMQLRRAGVTAEYAVDLRSANSSLSAGEIIRLRHSGVSSDFFIGMKQADASLSPEQVIRLRQAGVSVDFFQGMKTAKAEMNPEEAVRLRQAGLTPDYLKLWAPFNFSGEELVRLRHAGVSADYAGAIRAGGYDLSPQQIIRLRHSGITAGFITGVREAGYDFTWEELIRLRNNGVTPEYLAKLHVPGQKNLTADTIIEIRRRGLPPDIVQQIRGTAN